MTREQHALLTSMNGVAFEVWVIDGLSNASPIQVDLDYDSRPMIGCGAWLFYCDDVLMFDVNLRLIVVSFETEPTYHCFSHPND